LSTSFESALFGGFRFYPATFLDLNDEHQVAFNLWQGERGAAPADIYLSFSSLSERISLEQTKDGLQSDLARSARISLLGEMTASIAHEVNQPLGAIVASAEAGLRWFSRDEPDIAEVKLLLERIAKNGKRARPRSLQDPAE
jgi:signal transduction histidine kinase